MDDQSGHRKRTRERFLKSGITGFHDYEIVELLLTYGIPRKDCKPLAKELLNKYKSLTGVFSAPIHSLTESRQIGESAAVLIRLVQGIAEALLKEKVLQMDYFNNFRAVSEYIRLSMGGLKHEEFKAAFLNSSNGVIAIETLQQGIVNAATVYPRQIIELALKRHAASLICFHNHPGGNPQPSPQDRSITRDILFAARPLGITLHDHLILGGQNIYSFASEGEIDALIRKYESLRA
ncbi:MAG: DNA repair protein RadC [Nitrospinae bacterium]|nr:DNA repair protein RadC [Nitrospinota bacterium]